MTTGEEEQPALLPAPERVKAAARKAKPPKQKKPVAMAEVDPVARVLVDVALAHLDRPFDYAVPETMAADAQPGVRVKVRFAGQDVDGFVIERAATTEHTGRLQPLRRVVSPERVLTPDVAALTGAVAARYAGTRSDVLRMAVPPRHATVEKEPSEPAPPINGERRRSGRALPRRRPSWRAWQPGSPPGRLDGRPGRRLGRAAGRGRGRDRRIGRGALVCVPDHRDVDRLDAALTERLGEGRHVVLAADSGPAKRYRAFLAISRGAVRIVIGTRAAAFAPVQDLGLVAIWDDGDDLHDEPRAPYPHAREVLLMRAQETGCAALLAAHARSVEAEYLSAPAGPPSSSPRATSYASASRSDSPATPTATSNATPVARSARVPTEAFTLMRDAVRRTGARADAPRRLRDPSGLRPMPYAGPVHRLPWTLRLRGPQRPPECAWCATLAPGWRCAECGGQGLRVRRGRRCRKASPFSSQPPGEDRSAHEVGQPAERRR